MFIDPSVSSEGSRGGEAGLLGVRAMALSTGYGSGTAHEAHHNRSITANHAIQPLCGGLYSTGPR